MYENILVPTDGSKEAMKGAQHAVDLAAALDSTIHVLYVIEEGGNPWLSESMDDQRDRATEYGDELTGRVADLCSDAGVDCVTQVDASPDVYEKINEYADENDVDVIIMGTGYRGKFGALLGSTAEKVVRTANVPVTTIRRGDRE